MTRKLAISVPDDVAQRLDQESNVSAFITDSIRRRMAGERARQALTDAGFHVTAEGVAHAHAELDALDASVTPELRRAAEELRAQIAHGRPW